MGNPNTESSRPVRMRDRPQIKALRTLLRAHARIVDIHRSHFLKHYGLTMTEFDMIAALGNTQGLGMGELAVAMITTPGNVTRVAQSLEKRGFVERQRAAHSDREVIARLTEDGNAFFRDYFQEIGGFTCDVLDSGLSTAEQEQLALLLGKLHERAAAPPDPGGEAGGPGGARKAQRPR